MGLYIKSIIGNKTKSINLYKLNDYIAVSTQKFLDQTGSIKDTIRIRHASSHFAPSLSKEDLSILDINKDPTLNRIYGISFLNSSDHKEFLETSDRISKIDHRLIGKTQELFMLHKHSPGSPFFLKYGTRIVNRMLDLLRSKYLKYNFDEVITPQIFYNAIWKTSGHLENYSKDMFAVSGMHDKKNDNDKTDSNSLSCTDAHNSNSELAGLKPMNCPGHCLIFASKIRSYRELPLRIADLGPVHRNEPVGTLSGLTRVRRFHQDDGHIFCSLDSVKDEITDQLNMLSEVYSIFKFKNYDLTLSTRPKDKYIGSLDLWDSAESYLKLALNQTKRPWTENTGDGAFYGPKIDVYVQDALGRKHQTATIQLDFQLPKRFKLKYTNKDSKKEEPVIIHRAIFGSIERMVAILSEHYGGRWPFWISPRQALVVPLINNNTHSADEESLNAKIIEYAKLVYNELRGGEIVKVNSVNTTPLYSAESNSSNVESMDQSEIIENLTTKRMNKYRFFVDLKEPTGVGKLGKVAKEARVERYNYLIAVGAKELKNKTVNIRGFNSEDVDQISLVNLKNMFMDLSDKFE
ncbi:hypothetical protein BB561_000476 [Smittium simulii]|uniref:threonine--tRNA ligase n=1 Tax=Smittium simulii TaxID=133385 RepID=A0A2T9YYZ7_9FUNG|nr:hypothetical protein BB561_000476 [Smittium simulii]